MAALVALAPVAVEAFAAAPRLTAVSISADGRYLAVLTTVADRDTVVILDHSQPQLPPRPILTVPESFTLDYCRFAGATRRVCSLRGPGMYQGVAIPTSRLVAVDADPATDQWHDLQSIDTRNQKQIPKPIALCAAAESCVWEIGPASGRQALWRMTLGSTATRSVEFAAPDVDIAGPMFGPAGELLGVVYASDRPKVYRKWCSSWPRICRHNPAPGTRSRGTSGGEVKVM